MIRRSASRGTSKPRWEGGPRSQSLTGDLCLAVVILANLGSSPVVFGGGLSGEAGCLHAGGTSKAGPFAVHAVIGQPAQFVVVMAGASSVTSSWFPCTGHCVGDLNHDGMVDAADMGLLIGAWGTDGSIVEGSDINGDGAVRAADLGLLIGAWGKCQ